MSRARELARLANANAISVDTSNNVGLGTSVSINYKLDVVGDANFTGVITATSFGGDGSSLTGIAVTSDINTNNIKVSGISTFGSGASTFPGAVSVTNTTTSTSTSTGALIVSGGVGIAKSLFVGENVSIGGTLTYEDVTNIDSVGVVTAQLGVIATAGRGVQITAGGLNVDAGIGTFDAGLKVAGGEISVGAAFSVGQAGVVTAVSYRGDGSALTGVAATDNINTNNIAISGIATVGTSITMRDGAINVTGIVTATGLNAGISVWSLGADGTDHYTFSGPGFTGTPGDPIIYLQRGQKYVFQNRSGGHPFRIQSTVNGSSGTAYSDGVTNNDAANGTDLVWNVQQDAPDVLYYQCTSHANMGGVIYIGNRFQSLQEPFDFWMFGG